MLLLLILINIQSKPVLCSCADRNSHLPYSGEVDSVWTYKIINQNALLYPQKDSSQSLGTLNFNENLNILETSKDRVKIQRLNDQNPAGWVQREDILCSISPIKKCGLSKKIYIKTQHSRSKTNKANRLKNAYKSPDAENCDDCNEVERFRGYYIYDEKSTNKGKRYLISDSHRLDAETNLIGWVDKKDGFVWNNRYGLRPAENLVYTDGQRKGLEKPIFVYLTEKDALEKNEDEKGRPVIGGERWFRYDIRMAYEDTTKEQLYKVNIPLPGVGTQSIDKGRIVISPDIYKKTDEVLNAIGRLKNLDIFFIVSRKSNMLPYLMTIKETIKYIHKESQTENRFGIGLTYHINSKETINKHWVKFPPYCTMSDQVQENKIQGLMQSIDDIMINFHTISSGDNNFFDNIYDPILKFINEESRSCNDNLKLLFVVSNFGNPKPNLASLQFLKSIKNFINVHIYFIQGKHEAFAEIPGLNDHQKKQIQSQYDKAYEAFHKTARLILTNLGQSESKKIIQTNIKKIKEKIVSIVNAFDIPQKMQNYIQLDLKGGKALIETIQTLQNFEEYRNLPGLFWDILQKTGCEKLGEQCEGNVIDTVLEGYIPVTKDIVMDVWVTQEEFKKYKILLNKIMEINILPTRMKHQLFIHTLFVQIEKITGKPPYSEDTANNHLKNYFPVRPDSPLFNYTYHQYQQLTPGDIQSLINWSSNVYEFLSLIEKNKKPVYHIDSYTGPNKAIPRISEKSILSTNFSDNKMTFSHTLGGKEFYWIPMEFLP